MSTSIRGTTRREFLQAATAFAGLAVAPRGWTQTDATSGVVATPSGLLIRNPRPLCVESPLSALRTFETDSDLFFVRSHLFPPTEGTPNPTLSVDGEVARPLTLTLDALRGMPSVERLITLECAGNGRGSIGLPSTGGLQWGQGAIGTARFTGVLLANVLERAEVRLTARHFWMEAADRAPLESVPKFLRSIPRDDAMGDALIAYAMNGRPIAHRHGGPIRLVVPSWYGMASTKWLTHVHARPVESDNFFQARGYRYADGSPVERMKVKSLITSPLEGERVPVGAIVVRGVAWTGTGILRLVEVWNDATASWLPTRLEGAETPGAWRQFSLELTFDTSGEHVVRVRATDLVGNIQPEHAAPNPGGYGNNSIHEVRFHVVAR